jgi:hypothetical protein
MTSEPVVGCRPIFFSLLLRCLGWCRRPINRPPHPLLEPVRWWRMIARMLALSTRCFLARALRRLRCSS